MLYNCTTAIHSIDIRIVHTGQLVGLWSPKTIGAPETSDPPKFEGYVTE